MTSVPTLVALARRAGLGPGRLRCCLLCGYAWLEGSLHPTECQRDAEDHVADLRRGNRVTGAKRDQLADLKRRYDGGESIRSLAESTGRCRSADRIRPADSTRASFALQIRQVDVRIRRVTLVDLG